MTVSAFLAYVNDTFKAIWDPTMVAVEGEVSGFRVSQGQWVNFDLKDEDALVSVFMVLRNLDVPLQDGMRVRLHGFPRVYPKYGKFSFSADRVELVGEGAMRKALAMLRQKLEVEGLFDPTRKRSLTRFPERIALIASRDSAAYGDFVRIMNERWGGLEIDLYHVNVQGEKAPNDIVRAIQAAQEGTYDAIVITRGGGSFEELMAFNDERLVRAIFSSKIPTLVGIGHERDVSLAEEAADVRGSTPTDCARRLVPDRKEVLYELATMQETIADAWQSRMDEWMQKITATLAGAEHWLERVHSVFDVGRTRAWEGGIRWFENLDQRYAALDRVLRSYDPVAVVKRGYAVVRDKSGAVVTSANVLTKGAELDVQLRDGEVETVVQSIKGERIEKKIQPQLL